MSDPVVDFANAQKEPAFKPLKPLPPLLCDVPVLERDHLPALLASYVFHHAGGAGAPPEFVAAPLLVALGNLLGSHVGLRLQPRWREHANLWGFTVGKPASLKTPMMEIGFRPLQRIENAAREFWERNERPLIEKDLAEAESLLANEKKRKANDPHRASPDDLAAWAHDKREAEAKLRAGPPRFSSSDSTQEKLAELLIANPRGILQRRDELAGWAESLERKGREGERAFYLEGWSARGSYSVDRIGRGSLFVPVVCLGVFGTIQPEKLRHWASFAHQGRAGADGLLQRFGMVMWPDAVEAKRLDMHHVPDGRVEIAVENLFEDTAAVKDWTMLGAEPGSPPCFALDLAAQETFADWHLDITQRARREPSEPFGAHLGKYSKLVAALTLVFHMVKVVTTGARGVVGCDELRRAIALAAFLEQHARRVYGLGDPARSAAHLLAAKVRSGAIVDGMAVRDICRAEWTGLGAEEVEAAIATLTDCGVLVRAKLPAGPKGGQPSTVVRINPAWS